MKKNALSHLFPSLVSEWDYDKNPDLSPEDISYGSGKKVWWKCPHGHSYQAQVANRTKKNGGTGCPVCHGGRASPENNLLVMFPEIAEQWHESRNGENRPEDYRPKSHHKVWWQCPRYEGHEWEAAISSRTNSNAGCPQCGVSTSLPELRIYAELLHLFPDAKHRHKEGKDEVDIYLPSIRVGVEYDGAYYHKNKIRRDKAKGQRLLACDIQLVRVRVAPLKKLQRHDVVVKEGELSKSDLNAILEAIRGLSNQQWVSKAVKSYVSNDDFLDQASYQKFVDYLPNPFPENSCAAESRLVELWDFEANRPLTPENFSSGSAKEIWWACKDVESHKWKNPINVQKQVKGCPFCAHRRVSSDTSFATLSPCAAAKWHPSLNGDACPEDFLNTSNKKAWFQCDKVDYHVYEQAICNAALGRKCPFCSSNKLHPKDSLEAKFPEIAAEWSDRNQPLLATEVAIQSQKKRWWRCSKEPRHEWEAVVASRTMQGTGCPMCSGRDVVVEGSLADLYPDLAEEFDEEMNDKPASSYKPGSGKKVWWKCREDPTHQWQAVVGSRTKLRTGCPHCFNKKRKKREK